MKKLIALLLLLAALGLLLYSIFDLSRKGEQLKKVDVETERAEEAVKSLNDRLKFFGGGRKDN